MSTNQDNFDELIRQKFAEKEFVFNEENWEKMEHKIESNRRFGRTMLWSSIFSGGILVGVLLMFLFRTTTIENTLTNNTISVDKKLTVEVINKNESELESGKNNTANNSSGSGNSTANNSLKNEIATNNKNVPTNSSNMISPEGHKNANKINVISPEKGNVNIQKNTSITANNATKEKRRNYSSLNKTNALSKLQKNIAENSTVKKTKTKTSKGHNSGTSSNSNLHDDINTTNIAKVNAIVDKAKTSSSISKEKQAKSITELSKNDPKQNAETLFVSNTSNENKDNKVADTTTSTVLETSANNTFEKSDSVATKNNVVADTKAASSSNATAIAPPGLAAATFINVDIGTHYTLGWKYPDVSEGRGFNAIAGIGVSHYFNPKLAVNIGVQYASISNLKATKKTFLTKQYAFGSTTIDTTINTKYLHYLAVPLMVEYAINAKNSILLGGSASYLINSNSSITINSSSVGPAPVDFDSTASNTTKNSVRGYYNGAFNKFDATAAIGYRRRLTSKLSIAALVNFGLLDVKKDSFFAINKVERNTGFKLIVTYNLFDF